jgi:aldose 1-epimerase
MAQPEYGSVTLRDPASAMTATYVPVAGMVCTSLSDDGAEFLGQRRGLQAYVNDGKTMGIPILHPWANRLSATKYGINGAVVTLTPGTGGVRTDEHGVPIHGVLAANPGWLVIEQTDNKLVAVLDWGGEPRLLATFPFPHILTMEVTLAERTLTVSTTVMPSTAASVPLCYGYHPYLRIPEVPRGDWELQTPTMRHLPVDNWGIPTGATEEWPGGTELLKTTQLDHGFDQVPDAAVFSVAGGDRRVEVTFHKGYPAAQLFAPGNDDLVAVEPMAAPTDSLRRGNYHMAVPGKPETATFSIRVT